MTSLDTVWFQVGGTLCNLACTHCLVSASPTNRTHEMMSLEQIRPYLDEAARLGVKEYYFTGGEPFLNPEMERILEETLRIGPVTVLTNGVMLPAERCAELKRLAEASRYSLDLRVSLDGYDAQANDAIRGEHSFRRTLRGVRNLLRAGLNPVITVTEVCDDVAAESGRGRFFELLAELGVDRPRLKIMPVFKIGAEVDRSGSYASWQRVLDSDGGAGWEHLQCSSGRMVTDLGVWVCPILVNEPKGRMGARLHDSLRSFSLEYQACWTCHVLGASCRT